ncbi:MAG: diguanylate cyclase [Pyrinomonadaceae bacterium]
MKTRKQPNKYLWKDIQDELADKNGVAVVVVDENSSVVHESNNNSICQTLYSSEKFAPECDKFCGQAFAMASQAEKTVEYQCYAGLDCRAVPIKKDEKTQFVAIVGRAFTKAASYRNATEQAISGDWKQFPPTRFFENVLLKGSAKDLENVAQSVGNFNDEQKYALMQFADKGQKNESFGSKALDDSKKVKTPGEKNTEAAQADELGKLVAQFHNATAQTAIVSEKIKQKNSEEAEEIAAWRSRFGSLLNLSYKQACHSILDFISKRYSLNSLAWLERRENRLIMVFAVGRLKNQQIQISISADDERLKNAVQREVSLELHGRKNGEKNAELQRIQLFPIAVGGEIRSGLVVGDEVISKKTQRHIARFCQNIASELEILRLREELTRRGWLERAVQKFNENLSEIDSEDFWSRLTQISAELLRAERGSLLLLDEKSDALVVKAAIGNNADAIKNEKENPGKRVARQVLESGKSLVVADIDKIGLQAAPLEWKYKSKSFISYPLTIGTRKIGVLNLTDKTDGEIYSEFDLELLDAIMPQLAVLIDRAALKHKAGEFEQLSVTDALTGLLNRRYLEERLAEEIKRSNRDGFPMSFMMIDVDEFKSYNDNFSHPEGDKALKLVAHCLKDTLRDADVAARYGGEEFSVLLPRTTSNKAKTLAERIREKIESTEFPNRQVTVSIGIASCSRIICNAQEIISAADKALYEAKRRGRNNVQIFESMDNGKD